MAQGNKIQKVFLKSKSLTFRVSFLNMWGIHIGT